MPVRSIAVAVAAVMVAAAQCPDTAPQAPVDFSLSAPSASFTAIELGGNPTTTSIAISVIGEGTLNWTITDNAPWLSVTPSSGTGAATVTLSADIAGLPVGSHSAVVTITADGSVSGSKTVNVTLTVEPAPRIAFSADTLFYSVLLGDTTKLTKTLQITNAGGGTLNWTATSTTSWLSLSPTSGSGPGSITATISPALHQFTGTFVAPVTVTASGAANSPRRFYISFAVRLPPFMAATPAGVSATLKPGDSTLVTVAVSDMSGGSYPYTATAKASWLRLIPASGTAPDSLRLRLSAVGLAETLHRDTVKVVSTTASNSPLAIPVALTVSSATAPFISVTPSVVFKSLPPNDTGSTDIVVLNTGAGLATSWTAAESATWLSVTPSGTTPGTLRLSFNTAGLADGFYSDTVRVVAAAASNSPVKILVSVSVAPPRLSVQTFVFQQVRRNDTATRKLTVFAFGGRAAPVAWTATKKASWLSVNASGTTPDTLRLSFNTTGLAAGSFRDTITITAPTVVNSPVRVVVDLSVADSRIGAGIPSITLPPNDTATLKAAIFDAGIVGGVFSWSASAPRASWLTLPVTSGTTPDTLRFHVNTQGLAQGSYRDTILVTGNGASNSPFQLIVFLTVAPTLLQMDTHHSVTLVPDDSVRLATAVSSSIPSRPIAWTATASSNRIALIGASGSTPDSLRFRVRSVGLTEATYTDTITVTGVAANSPARVVVVTSVRPPQLTVGTGFVSLAANDTVSQNVQIGNVGGGTMAWTASSPASSWFTMTPTSGSATSTAASTIRVSYNSAGLAYGGHRDSVLISAPGATNQPRYLQVTLNLARPDYDIRSTSGSILSNLRFLGAPGTATPAPQTFRIRQITAYSGPKGMEWSASKSSSWLTLTPASGNTKRDFFTDIVASVNPNGLAEGSYKDTIVVTGVDAVGSPTRMVVVDFVYGRPTITVPADTIRLLRNTNSTLTTTFSIGNGGGEAMPWTATRDATWLTLVPSSGTINPGAASVVQAQINTNGLESGTYVSSVTVTAPNASNNPRSFPIKLTVVPPRDYDGSWSGTTEIGKPISFTISGNRITNISVGWTSPKTCTFTVDFTGTATGTPNLDASQPTWGGGIDDNASVSGQFTSASAAQGSVTVLIEYIEFLPGGVSRTCRSTSTVNWSATKQ